MRRAAFIVAGPFDARTGGSVYNRRMVEALVRRGWGVSVQELDDSFPLPTVDALERARQGLSSIPAGTTAVIDGLAFGAMPQVLASHSARLALVPIVHLPLAAAAGLPDEEKASFAASERQALTHARRVIVTGATTRDLMKDLALSHQDIVVVEPGVAAAPPARGSGRDEVQLLTVATLNAGKGHEGLIDALASLPHRRWCLRCAGSLTRDPGTVRRVRDAIARAGLAEHVLLLGELDGDALHTEYDAADIFVSPSLRETYGMAVAEALARGLPVVGTATGAVPELVGEDAGLIVPPGDSAALRRALRAMIDDQDVRGRCSTGALAARQRLRSWDEAAHDLATALTWDGA